MSAYALEEWLKVNEPRFYEEWRHASYGEMIDMLNAKTGLRLLSSDVDSDVEACCVIWLDAMRGMVPDPHQPKKGMGSAETVWWEPGDPDACINAVRAMCQGVK